MDVEAIGTCCPTCIKQLKIGLSQEYMREVKVLHLANVIEKAMQLE